MQNFNYHGKPDHKPHDHGKHKGGKKAQAQALQVECFDAATWGQINNQHTNRW